MSDERILDKFGATLRIGDVIRDSAGRLFQSRVFMREGKSGFVPSDLFGNATSDVKIYALNDDNTINSQFERIISDFERVRSFADTEGGYQYKKGGLTSAELAEEIFRNQKSDGQFRFTEDQIYRNLDYFGKQARYEYDEDELEWNKYDRGGQLEALRVKVLLQEAEQNLRRAGGLLYQNNHPNSDEFIRLYRDFEDRLQKILTPRKRLELNYAKGGVVHSNRFQKWVRELEKEGYDVAPKVTSQDVTDIINGKPFYANSYHVRLKLHQPLENPDDDSRETYHLLDDLYRTFHNRHFDNTPYFEVSKDGKYALMRFTDYPSKMEVFDGRRKITKEYLAKGGKTDDVDALAKQTLKKWWEYYDEMDGKRRREKELAFEEFKKANKVNVKNDYYIAYVFVNGEEVGFANLVSERGLQPLKRIKYRSYGYAKGGKTMDDKVSDKIRLLKDEGYGQEQAVAIALSMRDRGKLERGGLSRRQESILRNSSLQIDDGGSALNILDNAEGISAGDKDEIRVISEQAKRLAMELDDIYNENKR